MSISSLTTFTGLCMDIIGVLLLWRFGLPPDVRRHGHSFLLVEKADEAEKQKARNYDKISIIAVLLIVIGFAFQAVAVLLTQNASVQQAATHQNQSYSPVKKITAKPVPTHKK